MKTEEQKTIDELKEEIEHLKRNQGICARECIVRYRINEIVDERDRMSDYVKRLIEPLRAYVNGLPIVDDLEALIRESWSFTHFAEGRRFYTNEEGERLKKIFSDFEDVKKILESKEGSSYEKIVNVGKTLGLIKERDK